MARIARDRKAEPTPARGSALEGMALATMASGVVLGTLGAREVFSADRSDTESAISFAGQPDRAEHPSQAVAADGPAPTRDGGRQSEASHSPGVENPETPVVAEAAVHQAPSHFASTPSEGPADGVFAPVDHQPEQPGGHPATADDVQVTTTVPETAHHDLVARLSDQIADGVARMVESAQAGLPLASIGHELAQDIHSTVSHLLTSMPTAQDIIADAGIALGADDLIGGLSPTIAQLTSLPSTLLGAEHSFSTAGVLEDLFYRDGASATDTGTFGASLAEIGLPALPEVETSSVATDLSDAAMSVVSDLPPLEISLIGQGYGDPSDGHTGSLLNALHLA